MSESTKGKDKTVLQAVITCKCPKCREGDVFTHSILSISKVLKTHKNCPVCSQKYEIEPGFFWGALYISYGFNVLAILITAYFLQLFVSLEDIEIYIGTVVIVLLLIYPFAARYSRVLMLYLFSGIKYREE